MSKRLNDWQQGCITSGEFLDSVEVDLLEFLHTLSMAACHDARPVDVHFMVEQQRKVIRLMRDICHRLPDQHRR